MKTWVGVTLGVVALGVAGCFTLVAGGAYLLFETFDFEEASAEVATERFAEARARFGAEPPLVEHDGSDWRWHRRATAASTPPDTLHIMVWEADEDQLVDIDLPLWLLRLGDDDTVEIDVDERSALDGLDLSISDIDAHGPGLVLEHHDPGRTRVLVWAQ